MNRRLVAAVIIAMACIVGCAPAPSELHVDPAPKHGAMTLVATWGVDAGLRSPSALAVDPAGRVIVSDTANHRVVVFDQGQLVSTFGSYGQAPGELDAPAGLDVDAAGNIYVADMFNRRIQKFDPTGNILLVTQQHEDLPFLGDVDVDEEGSIYAISTGYLGGGKAQVFKFNAQGKLEARIGTRVAGYVTAMNGDLYVNNTFLSGRRQTHYLELYRSGRLVWRRLYDLDHTKGDLFVDPSSGALIIVHAGLARISRCTPEGDEIEVLVEEPRTAQVFPLILSAALLDSRRLVALDSENGRLLLYARPD